MSRLGLGLGAQHSWVWCAVFVLAANGCTEERRVVDAEPMEEAAGAAAVGRSPAKSGGAGASGSQAFAAAGSSEQSDTASDEPEAAKSVTPEKENYGWVKFERTPFGEGRTPNTQLRRQIKVTMVGDTTMLGKGYVMRSSATTSYVDVALAISNSNPELRCFVKAESVTWKTASGDVIELGDESQSTYLSGSVGDSSDSPTTTCLGPGEKGYFLEIQSTPPGMKSLFDSLAEVELTLAVSASSFVRPKYRVLPISWQGTTDELAVTFENMGMASAPIELAQGQFILTDGDGLPLTWGFLDIETALTQLGFGQRLVLKSDVYYDGKASNMLVSFGY
jgi:hypothetical protein